MTERTEHCFPDYPFSHQTTRTIGAKGSAVYLQPKTSMMYLYLDTPIRNTLVYAPASGTIADTKNLSAGRVTCTMISLHAAYSTTWMPLRVP